MNILMFEHLGYLEHSVFIWIQPYNRVVESDIMLCTTSHRVKKGSADQVLI